MPVIKRNVSRETNDYNEENIVEHCEKRNVRKLQSERTN